MKHYKYVVKRSNTEELWYQFRWTIKHPDGRKEFFRVRRSAKTGNARKAEQIALEHREALRAGKCHPQDPWPPPAPGTPKALRYQDLRLLLYQFYELNDAKSLRTRPDGTRYLCTVHPHLDRFFEGRAVFEITP